MIRLGSLAGYAFDGPRVLAGWTPPAAPGVYAILYPAEPDRPGSERLAVCYVGHADDLSAEGLPFRHPRSACWIARAGDRIKARCHQLRDGANGCLLGFITPLHGDAARGHGVEREWD